MWSLREKKDKTELQKCLKAFWARRQLTEVINKWPMTDSSLLSGSKSHLEAFHNSFTVLSLTSHRAEPKFLVSVIVLSGSTPLHVVSPSLRGTVSVVAVVVQEGKVAQSTIGIATTCLDQNCTKVNRKQMQMKAAVSLSMGWRAWKTNH